MTRTHTHTQHGVVANLLLSSEAFFDHRSLGEGGGEGGLFQKRVFLKRCNQEFSVLSARQPPCNTQSGSPTPGLFLICRFYNGKADPLVHLVCF